MVWVLCAVAALLTLGEGTLRIRGKAFRWPSPCALIDDRGCILLPHLSERVTVDGESFTFSTNSWGLRGRELTAEDAARRHVVVLGDSAAFGARVDDDEVFTAILDRRLAPSGVAVINTGSIY